MHNEYHDVKTLMKKNFLYPARFLLVILLVLALYPVKMLSASPISCDDQCHRGKDRACHVSVETMANHGNCCSGRSGKQAPCCDVQQDIPTDSHYFLPTTFRTGSSDLFHIGIIAFAFQSFIDQTDFYSRAYLNLIIPRFNPLYLQNLSFLC